MKLVTHILAWPSCKFFLKSHWNEIHLTEYIDGETHKASPMTFSMVGMSSRVKGEMMTWVGMSAGGGSSGSLMEKWTLLISRMANPHPRRSVESNGFFVDDLGDDPLRIHLFVLLGCLLGLGFFHDNFLPSIIVEPGKNFL